MICIEVKAGEYQGWRGVVVGIGREGKIAADTILSVKIAAPPEFDLEKDGRTVFLPQGWLSQLNGEKGQ